MITTGRNTVSFIDYSPDSTRKPRWTLPCTQQLQHAKMMLLLRYLPDILLSHHVLARFILFGAVFLIFM